MAVKKQLVADGGINSQGSANIAGTLTVTGNVAGSVLSGTNVNVTANATANNISANNVTGANVVATALTATTVTVGSTTANSTVVNATTVNAASVIATTVNVGTLNVVTANVSGNETVAGTLAVTGNTTFSANVTIAGNLIVNGGTTTVNTTQLNVSDNIISLNSDVTGAPSENAGIDIIRGTANTVGIRWNETSDVFEISNTQGSFGRIHRADVDIVLGTETSGHYVGNVTSSTTALVVTGAGGEGSTPALSIRAANTTVDGIVQLIDSVVSANVTTAATPAAVKVAYDAAIAANTLANTKVASVTGTSGRITVSGTSAAVLDLATTAVTPGTYSKVTVDAYGRVTANGTISTSDITEGTNLYYTDARARAAFSSGTGINYDSPSGTITNSDRGSSQNIFKTIADGANTVQFAADSNSSILRIANGAGLGLSFHANNKEITFTNDGVQSFNTRTGAVTLSGSDVTTALGFTPVQTFNTRTGNVVLSSSDVTTALGFSPVQSFNSRTGVVTLTTGDITGALGYTPADAASTGGTNASALATGTVPSGRISGSYTGISAIGSLSSLTVNGTTDVDTIQADSHTFNGDTDTGMYRVTTNQLGFQTGGSNRGTFTSSGLAVTGNVTMTNALSVSGNGTVGGNLTVTGTVSASSDERLKEEIKPIKPIIGMMTVNKLQPRCFNWKESGDYDTGYIAQEMQTVIPEHVHEDKRGYLAISVNGVSPYHTAALQFLYQENEKLRKRLDALEQGE